MSDEEIWVIKKKPINLDRVTYIFNPNTLKTVAGRAEFKASLLYISSSMPAIAR